MKGTFRLSMDWLHTWAGLLFGWLLFAIFLTGTAAMFRVETTVWMTPEHGRPIDAARGLVLGEARLREVASGAASWTIVLPDAREPSVQVEWKAVKPGVRPASTRSTAATAVAGREILDASGVPIRLRQTQGGDFFYNFHHRLDQPSQVGWWWTGGAAVVMLVCLVSGIVIHRRIFKDFFTFRPRGANRLAWLDAHTVTGILALPFHLMITYTGLAPMLITVMAAPIIANYAGTRTLSEVWSDYPAVRSAFQNGRRLPVVEAVPSGVAAPLQPLASLVESATRFWNGRRPQRLTITNPGDEHAIVELERHISGQLAYQAEKVFFEGASGRLLGSSSPVGPAWKTFSVMWGLHEGRFAGAALRWVYFVLGLLSTAMIGTGLVFWTAKRRARQRSMAGWFGHRLVERLNIGVITGLPIAMAAFLWANRLVPVDIDQRALVETRVFYLVWILMLVFAGVRRSERAWHETLTVATVAFAAIPVLNGLTTGRWLPGSLWQGDWVVGGFDMTMLLTGMLFGCAAWRLRGRRVPSRVEAVSLGTASIRTKGAA